MQPSGAWRKEASVRAAISKGCQQRCVYPVNKTLLQAMDRYALYRVKRDIGTSGESAYHRVKAAGRQASRALNDKLYGAVLYELPVKIIAGSSCK